MSANPVPPAAPPAQPSATPMDGLLGILNVFIDPASTARRVQLKWFWIYPLIVLSIISAISLLQLIPFTIHATSVDPPNGVSGPQLDQARTSARCKSRKGLPDYRRSAQGTLVTSRASEAQRQREPYDDARPG